MGSNNSKFEGKTVVIIGGGPAGKETARLLSKKYGRRGLNVVLVERRDTFQHVLGAPRAIVKPGFEEGLFIPYNRLLRKNGQVLTAHEAVDIDPAAKRVILADNTFVKYDALVIATGATYPVFHATSSRASQNKATYKEMQAASAKAKHITVIGAGPAGVELVGELKHEHPDAEVTLLANGSKVLTSNSFGSIPDAFRIKVMTALAQKGINVITGARVIRPDAAALPSGSRQIVPGVIAGSTTLKTEDGRSVQTDLQFWATGSIPNTQVLRGHLSHVLDRLSGRVRVRPTLQLEGYDDIFAIGDVANTKDGKQAYTTRTHAAIAAQNVAQVVAALDPNGGLATEQLHLTPYTPPAVGTLALTIGPNTGLGIMGGSNVPGFLIRTMKGKDLMTGMAAGELGYKSAPYID